SSPRLVPSGRAFPLFQFDLAFDLVGEGDAAERHRRSRGNFLVALEPPVRQGLPHCFLDLALGTHPQRLEKLANTVVEHVFVHWSPPLPPIGERRRPAAIIAAPDCANNSPIASM